MPFSDEALGRFLAKPIDERHRIADKLDDDKLNELKAAIRDYRQRFPKQDATAPQARPQVAGIPTGVAYNLPVQPNPPGYQAPVGNAPPIDTSQNVVEPGGIPAPVPNAPPVQAALPPQPQAQPPAQQVQQPQAQPGFIDRTLAGIRSSVAADDERKRRETDAIQAGATQAVNKAQELSQKASGALLKGGASGFAAADMLNSVNPFQSEEALTKAPGYDQAEAAFRQKTGDVVGPAVRTAIHIGVPATVLSALGLAGEAGKVIPATNLGQLLHVAAQAGKGALEAGAGAALVSALGAPEGQRAQAAKAAATDPLNLALGAVGGGAGAAGEVVNARRAVAIVPHEALGNIADEAVAASYSAAPVAKPVEITPVRKDVGKASGLPKNFEPSQAVIHQDAQGNLRGLFVEINNKGKARYHSVPLDTETDAANFGELRRRLGVEVVTPRADLNGKSEIWKNNAFKSPDAPDAPGALDTPAVPHVAEVENGKVRLRPVDGPAPRDVVPGAAVDVHQPGSDVRSSVAKAVENGKVTLADGSVVEAHQVAPAPRRPPPPPADALEEGGQAPLTAQLRGGAGNVAENRTVVPHEGVAPPPMPPQAPPVPGGMPDDHYNSFNAAVRENLKVEANRNPLIKEYMRNGLTPQIGQALMQARMANALDRTHREVQDALIKATGAKFGSPFWKSVDEFVKTGKADPALFSTPEWQKGAPLLNKMLDEIEQNKSIIKDLLVRAGVPQTEVQSALENLKGNLFGQQSVAREFLAHMLPPGEFKKLVVKTNLVDPATDRVVADMAKAGRKTTPEQVTGILNQVLDAPNPYEALVGEARLPYTNLKSLDRAPPEIRALMGEVNNGAWRIGRDAAVGRSIINQLKAFDSIAQDPSAVKTEPTTGYLPLNDDWKLGALGGKWVREDVWHAVKSLKDFHTQTPSIAAKLTSIFKNHVLGLPGGVGAFVHHLLGEILPGMLSGHSLLHPVRWLGDLATAFSAERAYANDPSGVGVGELARLARDKGVLHPGFGDFALSSSADKQLRLLERDILDSAGKGGDIWDGIGHFAKASKQAYQTVSGGLHDFYDASIRRVRLSNFIAARRDLLTRSSDGMYRTLAAEARIPLDDVMSLGRDELESLANDMAARRTRLSTSNPSDMAPVARMMQQARLGGMTPIVTPFAEGMRIAAQMVPRMATEPGLKYRMIGNIAALAGVGAAYKLYQHHVSGISQEAIDQAYKALPDYEKTENPVLVAGLSRDDNGRVVFHDLTHFFYPLTLLRHQPKDSQIAATLTNAWETMAGRGGFSPRPFLERAGLLDPRAFRPRKGEPELLKIVSAAGAVGAIPELAGHVADAYMHHTMGPPMRRSTLPQALAEGIGMGRTITAPKR